MNTEIGFIGLGRMGLNMATNLTEKGYKIIAYNRSEGPRIEAEKIGIVPVATLEELVAKLPQKKVIIVMVTSGAVNAVLSELLPLLSSGDTVIEGGNSFYKDTIPRHATFNTTGIEFLDCGVSGGMSGARHGASLMVGGKTEVFREHEHIFKALAKENGYARVGNAGAGHFVKMVHNGIEYGMMGAIAEGMNVLREHEDSLGISLEEVLKPYEHGSIITSSLMTWTGDAYREGQIDAIAGVVPRGETEEEMEHILTLSDVPVLTSAILQRKATREHPSYVGKLIAAMRNQFGGHKVVEK